MYLLSEVWSPGHFFLVFALCIIFEHDLHGAPDPLRFTVFGASDKTPKQKEKSNLYPMYKVYLYILRIMLLNLLPEKVLTKSITHSTSLNSSLWSHVCRWAETSHRFLRTLKTHVYFSWHQTIREQRRLATFSRSKWKSTCLWGTVMLPGLSHRLPPDTMMFYYNLQSASLQYL